MDGWMDGWMHGCMDAWMDGWILRLYRKHDLTKLTNGVRLWLILVVRGFGVVFGVGFFRISLAAAKDLKANPPRSPLRRPRCPHGAPRRPWYHSRNPAFLGEQKDVGV